MYRGGRVPKHIKLPNKVTKQKFPLYPTCVCSRVLSFSNISVATSRLMHASHLMAAIHRRRRRRRHHHSASPSLLRSPDGVLIVVSADCCVSFS